MALADVGHDNRGTTGPGRDFAGLRTTLRTQLAEGAVAMLLAAGGILLWSQGRTFELAGWKATAVGEQLSESLMRPSTPALWWTLAAAISWGISELIVWRRRRGAPEIVLATLFAVFAGYATFAWLTFAGFADRAAPLAASGVLTACAVHYARFRLPFTALPVGLGGWLFAVGAAALILEYFFGVTSTRGGPLVQIVTLIYGIGIFLLAIYLDWRGNAGEPSISDHGFWLHVLAAPLIVLPLAAPYADHFTGGPSAAAAAGIVSILVAATMVSLMAERRAVFLAAFAYPIAAAFIGAMRGGDQVVLLIVGAMLTLTAVGVLLNWRHLRRGLLWLSPTLASISR